MIALLAGVERILIGHHELAPRVVAVAALAEVDERMVLSAHDRGHVLRVEQVGVAPKTTANTDDSVRQQVDLTEEVVLLSFDHDELVHPQTAHDCP